MPVMVDLISLSLNETYFTLKLKVGHEVCLDINLQSHKWIENSMWPILITVD